MMKKIIVPLIIMALSVVLAISAWIIYRYGGEKLFTQQPTTMNSNSTTTAVADFQVFNSPEDFKNYLAEAQSTSGSMGELDFTSAETTSLGTTDLDSSLMLGESSSKSVERTSTTNVQVAGVDEPDIVKTDGENIFLSSVNRYYNDLIMPNSKTRPTNSASTQVISALPPDAMAKISDITASGNILLVGSILVVFSDDAITGYNVAQPTSPTQAWQMKLSDQTRYHTARLYQNTIYLVTRTEINESTPCPFVPLTLDTTAITLECNDIYHPSEPTATDTTFTVLALDPATGTTNQKISFVGSPQNVVLYMSTNNLYLTYAVAPDMFTFILDFFSTTGKGIIAEDIIVQLTKVNGYDISMASKMTEFGQIVEKYQRSLSDDERLKIENDMENKMEEYIATHKRELTSTTITKLALDTFTISATSQIPGTLLNQFSLDEYEGNLRLATTIGNTGGIMSGIVSRDQQTNDLYVLDQDLQVLGKVENLGDTERVYSARFIGDKGYVVTFKQTDPFFVFDLSNPKQPKKTGELKIPGYSSYLHPLSDTMILGVGKEGSNVKLSLFDVTDPTNPAEKAHYDLQEYSSDILTTHHAFTIDAKYKIFFVPGSKGGYIFSYANDTLELKKAVSDVYAQRALYINDYLYIVGQNGITVLSEKDWSEVGKLTLITDPETYIKNQNSNSWIE